jgi:hypothetical protein
MPIIKLSIGEFNKMNYEDEINFQYNQSNGKLIKNKKCQGKTKRVFCRGIDDDYWHEMPLTENDLNLFNTFTLYFNEFSVRLSINEMNALITLL